MQMKQEKDIFPRDGVIEVNKGQCEEQSPQQMPVPIWAFWEEAHRVWWPGERVAVAQESRITAE